MPLVVLRTWALAVLMLTPFAAAGCSASDPVAGCKPPANESLLLDAYAKEPVFGIQPAGSTLREQPKKMTACHPVGKFVSVTTVGIQWDLARNLTADEMTSIYGPVTAGAGWTVVQSRSGARHTQFCKSILGQQSILDLSWQDEVIVDGGKKVPGTVAAAVRTAEKSESSCP
jgi:hypothetical protein